MTNIKHVNEGYNKFCGPAVLSIITGKSTDECANAISRVTGSYKVKGVFIHDLLSAMKILDMDYIAYESAGSLYATITRYINQDGMYIISTPTHYVVIEINNKQVFFCDNHTKQPIPAAASARLGHTVVTIHKVWVREVVEPEPIHIVSEVIDVGCSNKIIYFDKVTSYSDGNVIKDEIGKIKYRSMEELDFIYNKFAKVVEELNNQ